MADGSSYIGLGLVRRIHDLDRLTLGTVTAQQMVVGCCDRCQVVGTVDLNGWRTYRDRNQPLRVTQKQTACYCGSRSVSFQVWPVLSEANDKPVQFYRWR